MSPEQAKTILRLNKDSGPKSNEALDPQVIRQAYERMIRRYPQAVFPERFQSIRAAYEALTTSDWKSLFEDTTPPTAWLQPYVKKEKIEVSLALESEKELLDQMFRTIGRYQMLENDEAFDLFDLFE